MSISYFFRAIALFVVFVLVWSCNFSDFEDLELAENDAEFAFPLAQTSINLQDLMEQVLNDTLGGDTILINPDGTMTLIYSGDLVSKPALDLFDFFEDVLAPVNDTFVKVDFGDVPNSIRVEQIDFTGGTATVFAQNSFNENVDFTLTFPTLLQNGMPFTVKSIIGPNQIFNSPALPIEGYVLTSEDNELEIRYEAFLPDGTRVKFDDLLPGLGGVGVSFQGLTFSYMQGYWGYEVYPLVEDTIEIDINQTDLEGNVTITDPKVTFIVANSWGFPTRLLVERLVFVDADGNETPLVSSALDPDSLDMDYPSFADGEVGQTRFTEVFFDRNNSNIDEVFNSQPVRLIYNIDGITNVDQDPDITGFITDSSVVDLLVNVELLLEGTAKNFGAEQTLDLNFGDDLEDLDTSQILGVEFKLLTENEAPIAADLQLYFLDDAGAAIDSLFINGPETAILAAPVNADGVSVGSERKETFVPMSTARFNRIRAAKQGEILTLFTTAQGGQIPVKLIATNNTDVKLGIKVKTRL